MYLSIATSNFRIVCAFIDLVKKLTIEGPNMGTGGHIVLEFQDLFCGGAANWEPYMLCGLPTDHDVTLFGESDAFE